MNNASSNKSKTRVQKTALTQKLERLSIQNIGRAPLSWIVALAWGCSRDVDFTESFANEMQCSAMSRLQARATLVCRLQNYEKEARTLPLLSLEDAETELQFMLFDEAVHAQGIDIALSMIASIPGTDWLFSDTNGEFPHDAFMNSDGCLTYGKVSLNNTNILARWQERPADRLLRLGGSKWSLGAVAYWVAKHSHNGFVEHDHAVPSFLNPMVLNDIRIRLINGQIRCRTNLRDDYKECFSVLKPVIRDSLFWTGHSLQESRDAVFDSEEVQRVWPLRIPPAWLSKFDTQDKIVAFLTVQAGMTRREATAHAQHAIPQGGKRGPKPGPRKRAPGALKQS